MDYKKIEEKWQNKWEETKLYSFDQSDIDNKKYIMEMFSYPSGANLHVGHWYNYGLSDTYARFSRMQGNNVFHPMGFDAFGLPAENYAIKTGIHPQDSTLKNIETMEIQLKKMGATFDWDYEVKTCMPDYYKWTQWMFLKLFENDLAYRKQAPVNWCNNCNTVLANEQVFSGLCERCDTEVERKNLTQWFFKITEYAEELLTDLDNIDWPHKTKMMQKNWIGKSVGGHITFDIVDGESFDVFTTRADTLYGCTYVVFAPEHPMVADFVTDEQKDEVEAYIKKAAKVSEIDRLSTTRDKTGVFTGAYAVNPINGRKVPIWISDYVLYTYGTGAVMAVPAHDERDFEFAEKFGLPIERVNEAKGDEDDTLPFVEYGKLVNSEAFSGLSVADGKKGILNKLKEKDHGDFTINYRLRDWLISRQRYWGTPIPIIHCDDCGSVPVPEEDLPVILPYDVEFTPDGTSPLSKHEAFINAPCPKCGKMGKREADTMDTFLCSSWYFLRYADNKNTEAPFDKAIIDKMLPVDTYIGGAEHACMHLLYSRFFVKALRDMGYLSFDEPFLRLIHQGTILGPDGERMSKSRGNVVSPDTYIEKYGSDVFRMYLAFGFSYIEGGPWNDGGIKSVNKFLDRIERLVQRVLDYKVADTPLGAKEKEIDYALNYAIQKVTHDLDNFQFNTGVARMMELVNALYKYTDEAFNKTYMLSIIEDLIKLLAPFAPHTSEELWEKIGNAYSVFNQSFPICDESKLVKDTIEMVLQVNGKVRAKFNVDASASKEAIEKMVYDDESLSKHFAGKTVRKMIVVPKRIVNVVAN
jgi:leucyl-tRNA synthetase